MRTDLGLSTWEDLRQDPKQLLVINFFTEGFYTREAFELLRSCQTHHLAYHMEQVSEKGDWLQNVNYKSQFILLMSQKFPDRPLLWLDADSRVRRRPKLLETIASPIAYHRFKGLPCDAVVYLAPGPRRDQFLKEWIRLVAADPLGVKLPPELGAIGAPTQYYFERAIQNLQLPHFILHKSYCWLWDYSRDRQGDSTRFVYNPVIEQMQANRIGKKLLSRG